MTLKEQFGTAIILRRKEQKISQEEFARKAGITRSYMSNIENGKRCVSIEVIDKIAKTFGITMSELLDFT